MKDDWQLAIETSAPHASVALARNGVLVAESAVAAARNHSAVLMAPLGEVLDHLEAGTRLAMVVMGTGPGSYNGARVGIAAGQGVALVHGCPAVGVCSLEAVAAARQRPHCLALSDARRGTFAAIELRDGMVQGEPELLEPEAFVSRVSRDAGEGACLLTLEDVARLKLPAELAGMVQECVPSAALLLEAWNGKPQGERRVLLGRPPQPFYLRPPHVTVAKSEFTTS